MADNKTPLPYLVMCVVHHPDPAIGSHRHRVGGAKTAADAIRVARRDKAEFSGPKDHPRTYHIWHAVWSAEDVPADLKSAP